MYVWLPEKQNDSFFVPLVIFYIFLSCCRFSLQLATQQLRNHPATSPVDILCRSAGVAASIVYKLGYTGLRLFDMFQRRTGLSKTVLRACLN